MADLASGSGARLRLVIVGGGAAGILVAARVRLLRPDALITVVDASGRPGKGAAFGTADSSHLLNVPASNMSAWSDRPDDFSRWLQRRGVPLFEGFAPRNAYGCYLQEILTSTEARVEHAEVVNVVPGSPARVSLGDGRVLAADGIALATGRPPGRAPGPLERALAPVSEAGPHGRLVVDPWAPGALAGLVATKPARVLVVGSGPTGVDVALHLVARDVEVTLVSRHGQLPRRHRATGPPTDIPAIAALPERFSLSVLLAAAMKDFERAKAMGSDWRQVVDGIRPHTPRLWRGLSTDDQRRFIREHLRDWEVLRHRMPRAVSESVQCALASGRLRVIPAEVVDSKMLGRGFSVTLSGADGTVSMCMDGVVVATGTNWDRRALDASPLWHALIGTGVASPHPSGIGVRTDDDGHLIDGKGVPVPGIVCLGAIRQGEIWESTAILEIREQAARAASLLAEATPTAERVHPTIAFRPAMSDADAAYTEGVRRLLAVQQGASRAFEAAITSDPHHARAHAALALIATERPDRAGGRLAVASHLRHAFAALGAGSTKADRSHVEALAVWCEQGSQAGTTALTSHLERAPDDALALVVLAPSIAFAGAGDALPDVWQYIERFAPVHGEAPWFLGLLAYGRTEQMRLFEAADLSEAALGEDSGNGNAAHALSHVHYETDAHVAGLRWLEKWIAAEGRTQRYLAHFHWHAALHELAMGDTPSAARRYAAHLAPPHSTGLRCLIDAGSLAWRARLDPAWVAPPDPMPVIQEVGILARAPSTPFVAFHALLLHAANEDVGSVRSVSVPGLDSGRAATVRAIGEGLAALLEGNPRRALDQLLEAVPGMPAIGGSRAQQEVVLETALAAMLRLGAPGQATRLLYRHRDRGPIDKYGLGSLSAAMERGVTT